MAQAKRHGSRNFKKFQKGRGKLEQKQLNAENVFPTERLQQTNFPQALDQNGQDGSDENDPAEELLSESESGGEARGASYAELLRTLRTEDAGPPKKKRRLADRDDRHTAVKLGESLENDFRNGGSLDHSVDTQDPEHGVADRLVPAEVDEDHDVDRADEGDESQEDIDIADDQGSPLDEAGDIFADGENARDSFEQHFVKWEAAPLISQIDLMEQKKSSRSSKTIDDFRFTRTTIDAEQSFPRVSEDTATQGLKSRLQKATRKLWTRLSPKEQTLAASTLSYQDQLFGARSLDNSSRMRELMSLHILNHILRTRDRLLKNNSRLAGDSSNDSLDLRDQGFTRPKVLILLPTRNACVKFVECLINLFEPEQQENRARFLSSFAEAEEKDWSNKPDDFQDLFEGNDDDMFRIGIKFTRKTLKFFSQFYQSDIILASPLGLRTAIEGKANKNYDADFLSSIEITLVDHADALLMQNWDNVTYIFSQLNLLPKASHDCDFSRVRTWYLDGQAKYLRQTIILSSFLTPDLTSLFSNYTHNLSGLLKTTPTYSGTITSPTLPLRIPQTFIRFSSPTPQSDPSARFTHFTTTILPSLLRPDPSTTSNNSNSGNGTLLFIPSYFSFVPLRNHLTTSPTTTSSSLSFTSLSEYTSASDAARARAHFASGRHSLLLYTERAHHFRRYRSIRGVAQIVFYGVPENPRFWEEVVAFLGDGGGGGGGSGGNGGKGEKKVKALFSRWDAMKLERIVGTERVAGLLREGRGDVFEFF